MKDKNYIEKEYFNEENITKRTSLPVKITRTIFDSVQTVVISLSIFLVVYLLIASPAEVLGSSMFPNLQEKEILLTDKISGKISGYKRGDIVVIKLSDTKDIIKRIIGLPGEKIKISDGRVFINGKLLIESYLSSTTQTHPSNLEVMKEGEELEIPKDGYFVLGDNREVSYDSRSIGFITPSTYEIKSKAFLIYWPPDKAKIQEDIKYNL